MKVAIIQYSTYGHLTAFSKTVTEGVIKSGVADTVDIFHVPETLSDEVLTLIHAPKKDTSEIPLATNATLEEYDAFLFGVPTRFGTLPAQWSAFWDATGGLWAKGALYGKPAGIFVSTGSPHGGQETTIRNFLSYVAHHGLIYVPLGYGPAFAQLLNLTEIHGGSAYGAGLYAGTDGSRLASKLELEVAAIQGEVFAKQALKFVEGLGEKKERTTAAATGASATEKTEATAEKSKKAAAKPVRASQSKPAEEEKASKCKCVIM